MIEHLRKVPLFSELSDDNLLSIAQLGHVDAVPPNTMVLQEGDKGDALFIVLEGRVKICYYAPDGREVILSILEEGQFFGEMALLACSTRSATVITMTTSRLAQIRCQDFKELLRRHPEIAVGMLAEVTGRLRRTSQLLERLSTMNVPARLYMLILDQCHQTRALLPSEQTEHFPVIELPIHQVLADQIATSRETVSRAISRLKKNGILTPVEGRHNFFRVDVRALETLTQIMV
ncbi:MAG: Crp/Fnr family transcriptional regulator [Zetaproteobacteria bacterium]|nr:MAG: Crp/Fnr family transcriptional regulator [Zetaproteobacteria bacterium]